MTRPGFSAENSLYRTTAVYVEGYSRHAAAPAGSITAAMMDPNQQAYHDCMVDCRREGGTNCASQCTPKTVPSGGDSTPLTLCDTEYDAHPIFAELFDMAISKLHDSGVATQDQCYAAAAGVGAVIGAAIAKVPFPWSLFGAVAAADIGILGKCLCDKYYG